MRIEIKKINNATKKQEELLYASVADIEKIANTPVFKKELFKVYFDGIINHETLYNNLMKVITINEVEFYRNENNKVLGAAINNDNKIRLNSYYWDEGKLAVNSGTLMHETSHLLGYRHDNSLDYDSVPYALGNLIRKLSTRYQGKEWQCYRPWYFLWLIKICKFR